MGADLPGDSLRASSSESPSTKTHGRVNSNGRAQKVQVMEARPSAWLSKGQEEPPEWLAPEPGLHQEEFAT